MHTGREHAVEKEEISAWGEFTLVRLHVLVIHTRCKSKMSNDRQTSGPATTGFLLARGL